MPGSVVRWLPLRIGKSIEAKDEQAIDISIQKIIADAGA